MSQVVHCCKDYYRRHKFLLFTGVRRRLVLLTSPRGGSRSNPVPARSLLGYDAPMREKPGGDSYSVDKAAKVLGRTPERIRQMLRAGHGDGS